MTAATIFLFAAGLGWQGPTSQASQHPAGVDLYVEVPDVSGMLASYRNAPAILLLNDGEIRKTVERLVQQTGFDLDGNLERISSQLGIPAELAENRAPAVTRALGEITAFSFSASAGRRRVMETRSGDGETHGEVGAGDDVDRAAPQGAAPQRAAPEGMERGLLAVWELKTEEAAEILALTLQKWLAGSQRCETEVARLGEEDGTLTHCAVGGTPGENVWVFRSAFRVRLGVSWDPHALFEGTADARGTLDGQVGFQGLWTKLPPGAEAIVFQAFLFRPLAAMLSQSDGIELPQEMSKALSSTAEGRFGGRVVRMQLVRDRFVTEMFAEEASRSLDEQSFYGRDPLSPALLGLIPGDAIGVFGASFDSVALCRSLERLLRAGLGEERWGAAMKPAEQKHFRGFEAEFGSTLGSSAVVYLGPVQGLGPPNLMALVDLRDATAFQSGLDGLIQLLAEASQGAVEVRSKPYRDVAVTTMSLGKGVGVPPQVSAFFSPSVAVVKSRCLIALSSGHARREIRRLLGDEGELHPLLSEASGLPDKVTRAAFVDWGGLFAGVYDAARALLTMVSAADATMDVSSLPDADAVTRYFRPTVGWSAPVAEGVRTHVESSFGPETWLGLAALGFAGGLIASQDSFAPQADAGGNAGAAGGDSSEDPGAATRRARERLLQAIVLYRRHAGRPPVRLEDLSLPTALEPAGFLGGEELPKDGWGRDFAYGCAPDGVVLLWSLGPDGVDQRGGGDNVAGD